MTLTSEAHRADVGGRLTLAVPMVLYGLGDTANAIRGVLSTLFLLFFYTSVMGVPGTVVGIASGIGLLLDAAIDPLVGQVSDRARLPLGRRHGLMLVGAVGMGLSSWVLFSPPRNQPLGVLVVWFVVATLLVRVTGSIFSVPYCALGAELRPDDAGRAAVAGIRGACSMVAGVGATLIPLLLFFPNRVPGVDPKLNYDSYPAMGLALGGLMTLAGLVATFGTLRRAALTSAPASVRTGWVGLRGLQADVLGAFGYPAFRALFASFALIYLGSVINVALGIHFLTYYARIFDSTAVTATRAAFYGGALVSVPMWVYLTRGPEKHRLYAFAGLAAGGLLASGFFLVGDGRIFGTGAVWPIVVGQALGGLVFSLFWIAPWAMLADITDADTAVTGQQRQGLFFGITSFGQKLVTGVSIALVGVLIDRFAGLAPGQVEQSALTVERIGLLASVLPGALLAAGGLLVVRYPRSSPALMAHEPWRSAPRVGG